MTTTSPTLGRAAPAASAWHRGPLVDTAAYAFSWVFALGPLLLLGGAEASPYGPLPLYLAILAISSTHRHVGLPYVYLDREVRERHPLRFLALPLVLALACLAAPGLDRLAAPVSRGDLVALACVVATLARALRRDEPGVAGGARSIVARALPGLAGGLVHLSLASSLGPPATALAALLSALSTALLAPLGPERSRLRRAWLPAACLALGALALVRPGPTTLSTRALLDTITLFAAAWNIWHVLMQKFGIFRMYAAKRMTLGRGRADVPAWVDRLLVFGWVPLWMAVLGPRNRELVVREVGADDPLLPRLLDGLVAAEGLLVPLGVALVLAAHVTWLRAEHAASGLKSAPRLTMAAGTSLLSLALCFFDPIKVYLAWAASHAIEYVVFVHAFQERRYREPLAHRPLLGRLLAWPKAFWLTLLVVPSALYLLGRFWGTHLGPVGASPTVLGHRLSTWVSYYAIFQSLAHFYFDGFLWKMRRASVRRHL